MVTELAFSRPDGSKKTYDGSSSWSSIAHTSVFHWHIKTNLRYVSEHMEYRDEFWKSFGPMRPHLSSLGIWMVLLFGKGRTFPTVICGSVSIML